ncbi:GNAT family N-acetyltransferase [Wenzhouxiangella sp. XN201]|uniref:GNAT family N-acetyltransferase n=1 Tax=Wenzhouxiangella sp. XN201 TaxID=2710755 RepID=UPI0013CA2A0C|nr:GNAT family N-acetyltransferase [Wenzhouxiangella sp. XN201]NEZ02562.1 GNAT family N-acetyltransferase [Wenzhouxiangella sp. XN201]
MEIVDLSPDQIPAAGTVLTRALFEDGLAQYMYPDEEERQARIPWHFSAMVRYGVLFGRVLTTVGEPRGVAVWLPPDASEMTDNRIAAAGMDASPAVLGEEAFGRFMNAMAEIEPFREQDVAPRHWYLALVGVDPDYSGQGIGSSLLRPIFAEADAEGLPCYLETAEERNVAFYQKHGFETVRHGTVANSPVEYWTMRR